MLIEAIEDYAIYALDAAGRVISWNAGAELVKGYRAEEIIGEHVSCFYLDDDVLAGKPERDLAVATADGHLHVEGWRKRRDGSPFWASVSLTALRGSDGRLIGFGKVTRDLTDRRRDEELLRESEERFRLLVNSVADYAIFLLDPDGRVASWNLGAERLKGYRADEVIGRHFSVFYPPEEVRAGTPQQLLRTALESGRVESEGWRLRQDGSRFWASVVITVLHSPDGTHRGFAKVTKDLTDRKRNEDALRSVLERERAAADRLRELDRIRTGVFEIVTHDLRAPLGVIQGVTELLRAEWSNASDETKLQHLTRISARAAVMSELVEDLMSMIRIESGQLDVERRPFDVAEVLDRAIADALAEEHGDRVRITVAGDVHALGDERRTWDVLSNLLTNAAKFSPVAGPIEVDVRREGHLVVVAVSDSGPGIPADEQHLVFERFSRLTSSRGIPGSGLGLFIAKSLVEAQGGTISVRSAIGAGSTFRFTLPAAG